ncbi:hypothetical protein [Brucella pseudogrignonensis]|uniref:Uncharacterized protein n=1 Tax=Brucella pseudogrignonensis TaxID=419475 RepID=A0ABU1MFE8_9HYPH|nr:hypothetical protein [Brucella pseudogrignonensis]MDR6434769.1 hypothetical protein [Brucella pseudogrignonensis]
MDAGVVMIILTLLSGGEVSSTFVNVDTRAECNERLARIRPVLESGEIKLEEAGCFDSSAQFDDFDHSMPQDAPRYSFLVKIDGDHALIRKHKSAADCQTSLELLPRATAGQKKYCTTSTQDLIVQGG